MNKERVNRFLSAIARRLEEWHWGSIEPEWFDPKFAIDQDQDDQEREWATDLQKHVLDALAETED